MKSEEKCHLSDVCWECIYNELVCMERWDKVCTRLLGEVSRIGDCEKSEVARENCQTTIQAWCLWRELERNEDWLGEIWGCSNTMMVKFRFLSCGSLTQDNLQRESPRNRPVLLALHPPIFGGSSLMALWSWHQHGGGSRIQRSISRNFQSPLFIMAAIHMGDSHSDHNDHF